MNKEFIPYDQALELKELGFDDDLCLFYYADNEALRIYHQSDIEEDLIGAPLYQQVFKWFREKYQIYPNIVKSAKFGDWICEWQSFGGNFQVIGAYHHYEEAELACLKKLIEIVKNK